MRTIRLLPLFLFLFIGMWADAQTYPVNVTGTLVPPNSLRIGDYFDSRANDVMFTIVLNDPIQQSIDVRFRLSIESNGGEILGTDINFFTDIITLDQGVPETFDGTDLDAMWQQIQLQGGFIPEFLNEGFNGICLEVIETRRNSIVSNKGCAVGFFQYAQPPQLQSPLCDNDIETAPDQDFLINWLALHQASGNPIADVEYELTIVEMGPGIQNPMDAFNGGMVVMQTTQTNLTSYNFSANDPILTLDQKYAWRVKATGFDFFGDQIPVFANAGFSEICTFTWKYPPPPPDPDDFSSCTGNSCQFTGSIGTLPKGTTYFTGEEVKIGDYKMIMNSVSYDDDNKEYSGTGSIYVPFLGTSISVDFSGLKVNIYDRVYGGEVKAAIDNPSVIPGDFVDDFTALNQGNASQAAFSNSLASDLKSYFDNTPTKLTSNLAQNGPAGITALPIGLDVDISGTGIKQVIAVTDILFTATEAKMNAIYVTDLGNDKWGKFGGKGICIRKNGLTDATPKLFLLGELQMESSTGLPINIVPVNAAGQTTHLEWDCGGFQELSLAGTYEFNNNQIKPINPSQEKVIASFSSKTDDFSNFVASLDAVPAFEVVGFPGFTFKVDEAYADFSVSENPNSIVFPEGYSTTGDDWEGFYFKTISMELPTALSAGGMSTDPVEISANDIIFDAQGLTGEFFANNIFTVGNPGSFGGWDFSLSEFKLNFSGNSLLSSNLLGGISLPILGDGEFIDFTGLMIPTIDGITGIEGFGFELGLPNVDVPIDLLRSIFNFGPNSKITLGLFDGSFTFPRADLFGSFELAIPDGDSGMDADFMAMLTSIQGAFSTLGLGDLSPNFDFGKINFSNMTFDLNTDPIFDFGDLSFAGSNLSFLGFDMTPVSLSWGLQAPDPAFPNIPKYGFDFDVSMGDLLPDFTFNFDLSQDSGPSSSGSSPGQGGGMSWPSFDFGGFDLDFEMPGFELPDFNLSCGDDLPEIDISNTVSIADLSDLDNLTKIKVGFFDLEEWENLAIDAATGKVSGIGRISIPALGPFSELAVNFQEVIINEAGQIVDGVVTTAIDDAFDVAGGFQGSLENIYQSAQSKVSNITSTVTDLFELPIVIGIEDDGSGSENGLVITGLTFGPQGANIEAKLILPVGDNYLEFSAAGLSIVPDGLVVGDIKMGLTNDITYDGIPGDNPLIFKAFNSAEGTGSYVSLDCGGFVEFNLTGEYSFPENLIINTVTAGEPVTVTYTINSSNWGDFIGVIDGFDGFTLPGLNGFSFEIPGGLFDASSTRDIPSISFPDGFEIPEVDWTGFYMPTININLPDWFGTPDLDFDASDMVLDWDGVSGNFGGFNLFDINTGNLGGWGFGIDSFSLNIFQNDISFGGFNGGIQLPFMSDLELLPLDVTFSPITLPNGDFSWDFDFKVPQVDIPIGLLRGIFNFGEGSTMNVPYTTTDGFGLPTFNFDGSFDLDFGGGDSGWDPNILGLLDGLEGALSGLGISGISPEFNFDGIEFTGMSFDWNASPKLSFGSFNPINLNVDFLGFDCSIGAIEWFQFSSDSTNTTNPSSSNDWDWGWKFDVDFGTNIFPSGFTLPKIDFDLTFNEDDDDSEAEETGGFSFSGFDLDWDLPSINLPDFDFECGEDPGDVIDITNQNPIPDIDGLPNVQIGLFDLGDLESVVRDNATGRFSGVGRINVPSLGPFSDLAVNFQDVLINESGRIVDGQVNTLIDNAFASANGLQGSLQQIYNTAQSKVAEVTTAVNDFFTLPIVLGVEADGSMARDQGLIITGLSFGPESAEIDAKVIIPMGGSQYLEFDASGLKIGPNGIVDFELKLGLTQDIDLDIVPGDNPVAIKGFNSATEEGSYVKIDCGGFAEFNLRGEYEFPTDVFVNAADASIPVTAALNINTVAWGDFIGTLDGIVPFYLPGLNDFVMTVQSGWFDGSASRELPIFATPEGYAEVDTTWEGFYIPMMTIDIPAAFTGGGDPTTFTANNMIIDHAGVSAVLQAENLIDPTVGSIAGWGFGVDSIQLNIMSNQLVEGFLMGGLQIPLMTEEELMPMRCDFLPVTLADGTESMDYAFQAIPQEIDLSLLRSKFTFNENSEITIGYQNGQFELPKLDLSGVFSMNFEGNDDGFTTEIMDQIDEIEVALASAGLGALVPEMNFDGIAFENFVIDMNDIDNNLSIGSLTPLSAEIDFLGMISSLSSISFLPEIDSLNLGNPISNWKFQFDFNFATNILGPFSPDFSFDFDIFNGSGSSPSSSPSSTGSPFSFGSFDFDWDLSSVSIPDFDFGCTDNIPDIDISNVVSILSIDNLPAIKIGHFNLTNFENITRDASTGKFSGIGRIEVPMLGPFSEIAVNFQDVIVNEAGRIVDGEVNTLIDAAFDGANGLQGTLAELATAAEQKVTNLVGQAQDFFTLPLVIGAKADGTLEKDQGVIITGLEFGPQSAIIDAKVILPLGNNQYVEFFANGLEIVPNGIANIDLKLGLANSFDLPVVPGDNPLVINGFNPTDTSGSYVAIDCGGFVEFNLSGSYDFPTTMLVNKTNASEPVTVTVDVNTTEWGDFLGTISGLSDFTLPGMDDFTFSSGPGILDFSTTRNSSFLEVPEVYGDIFDTWEGFYLPNLSISFPDWFSAGGSPLNFNANHLMIDQYGVTTEVAGYDLVDLDDGGNLGGIGFKMDTVSFIIHQNGFNLGNLVGGIQLPIMSGGEFMPVFGSFAPITLPNGSWDWEFDFDIKPVSIPIDLFRAEFTFDPTSVIDIDFSMGDFSFPTFNLNGAFELKAFSGDSGFDADFLGFLDDIEASIPGLPDLTPGFEFGGIQFSDMKFDWNASPKFSLGTLSPIGFDLSFLGIDCNLDSIKFISLPSIDGGYRLDIKMDFGTGILGGLAPNLNFNFDFSGWGSGASSSSSSSSSSGSGSGMSLPSFAFDGFDLDFDFSSLSFPSFDFSCAEDPPPLPLGNITPIASLDALSEISVGYFNLTDLADLTRDATTGKVQGVARVNIPALGPFGDLAVSLQDVVINEAGRIVDGTVNSLIDEVFASADGLQGTAQEVFQAGQNKIQELTSTVKDFFELPIVLGVKADGTMERDQGLIITGIEFGPESAIVDAKVILPIGGGNFAEFIASGVELVPNGIASVDLKFGLSGDFDLGFIPGMGNVKIRGFNPADTTGSYVAVDCGGFVEFNLDAFYEFDKETFVNLEEGKEDEPVSFNASINTTKWGDFLGTIGSMDTFALVGAEEFPFVIQTGVIDGSTSRNAQSMKFPEGYTQAQDSSWQGFFMPLMKMKIPTMFASDGSMVGVQDFLIDTDGGHGKLIANNLIPLETGSLAGWGFSMDSLALKFENNQFIVGSFNGGLQIPLMSEEEAVPYGATFAPDPAGDYSFDFQARPATVDLSLLRSKMIFDTTSTITIQRENKEWLYPVVDLDGDLVIDFGESDSEFIAKIDSIVRWAEESFGLENLVPNISFDSIRINGFKFDPNSADAKFAIESILPKKTEFNWLSMDLDLAEINFKEAAEYGWESANSASLKDLAFALEFELELPYLPAIPCKLAMLIDELDDGNGGTTYAFGGFEYDIELPDITVPTFSCESVEVEQPENQTPGTIGVGSNIKIAGFSMKVTEMESGDKGKGIIPLKFLGYDMNVSFDGIVVNTDGEVISGEILTDTEASLIPESVSEAEGTDVPFIVLSSEVEDFLQSTADYFTLPISLRDKMADVTDFELPEGLDLVLLGLIFTPEGAQMNMSISIPYGVQNEYFYFGARGLSIRPNGIDLGQLDLFLAETIQF